MLKVTQPYVRETAVRDHKEGKNIVVKIEPPGLSIGFRLRGGRITWHLNTLDAYMAARYSPDPDMKEDHPRSKPKPPEIKDQILSVLREQGKLNINQVRKHMKTKGTPLGQNVAGTILEMMKEAGLVKQEGFSYSLVQGGK